ncbi:MAG: peptidoglycan DD-metalloendopeptidase family protein, partial [Alphaproteobacteria bacterium]
MAVTINVPFLGSSTVTQGFGDEDFSHKSELYWSWDFSKEYGSSIVAEGWGRVIFLDESVEDFSGPTYDAVKKKVVPGAESHLGLHNYGNYVTIEYFDTSGNVSYYATYMHLQQNSVPFKQGDTIHRGNLLGKVGRTGLLTGTHVHVTYGPNLTSSGIYADGKWTSAGSPVKFEESENLDGLLYENNPVISENISLPDLQIDNLTTSENIIKSGDAINVDAVVRNYGGVASDAFSMGIYISRNPTYDSSAIELATFEEVEGLAPGAATDKLGLSVIFGDSLILLRQEIASSDVTVRATLREDFLGGTGHERGSAGTVRGLC